MQSAWYGWPSGPPRDNTSFKYAQISSCMTGVKSPFSPCDAANIRPMNPGMHQITEHIGLRLECIENVGLFVFYYYNLMVNV